MAAEVSELKCSNQECRVAETGKCVEGLPLEECPHYGGNGEVKEPASDTSRDPAEGANRQEGLSLPSGERLSIADASAVLRVGETRVVAIIGPTEAGKTSLIASLYDLFQIGPVAKLEFARSRTLPALEQACHHARAVSQRATPYTERTPLSSGVGFYHLGLRNPANSALIDLLLADRPGEDYRSAADDPSVCTGFVEVLHADSISILVDGNRLADTSARHNVQSEIQMILQGLVDGDAVRSGQQVAFVLTKLDEVNRTKQKGRAERDFGTVVETAQRLFGNVLGKIVSFAVAASPATDELPRGHGVAELLQFWAAPRASASPVPSALVRPERAMGRVTVVAE
jgi:double-GTPase-like protein